ncbi:hypothetical protein ABVK25_010871 [Lepraria finkii]|uniref:Uncharacterized protein n=1 Tax=Lepraria finkii TaxID=1340010 RepID=A0ABR4ATR2_9LECA
MAPQAPLATFNYDANPGKRNWTVTFMKSAYQNDKAFIVSSIFNRVRALVKEHKTITSLYKAEVNSRKAIDLKRTELSNLLVHEFRTDLEVAGQPDLLQRACRGIVGYAGGSGATTDIKQESLSVKSEPEPTPHCNHLPETDHSRPLRYDVDRRAVL